MKIAWDIDPRELPSRISSHQTRATDTDSWEYDPRTGRFRNTVTGRFISHSRVIDLRDQYIVAREGVMSDLVSDVVARGAGIAVGTPAWDSLVADMSRTGWREAESTFITEYALGKGGVNNMGSDDYVRLDAMLAAQRVYWDGFMNDVRSGKVSTEAGIRNRMNMYTNSSRGFHSRGTASAWDIELPTYPGETLCGHNCRCSWRLSRTTRGVEAFWELGGITNNCEECLENSGEYKPYLVELEEKEGE